MSMKLVSANYSGKHEIKPGVYKGSDDYPLYIVTKQGNVNYSAVRIQIDLSGSYNLFFSTAKDALKSVVMATQDINDLVYLGDTITLSFGDV